MTDAQRIEDAHAARYRELAAIAKKSTKQEVRRAHTTGRTWCHNIKGNSSTSHKMDSARRAILRFVGEAGDSSMVEIVAGLPDHTKRVLYNARDSLVGWGDLDKCKPRYTVIYSLPEGAQTNGK